MRALCAIDLDADPGVDAGRDLLVRLGATVDLVHVAPTPPAVRSLAEVHAIFPPELRGEALVVRGDKPADEIAARAAGYDLLVVGTAARHGPPRSWLGSVAEKLIRTSPVPVLVARGRRREDPPRVLVAVDAFAATADAVVVETSGWATRLGARVDLGCAVTPLAGGGRPPLEATAWEPAFVELERDCRQRLSALARHLPDAARGVTRVGRGEPAECVADWSAGYHLTIVGSHQRRGLGRMWLGSVAERVARTSWSPVLVLPLR